MVISSIYFHISSIFISLWNNRSRWLSFSSLRVRIFSAINCLDNCECYSWSLILDLKEPVISVNFIKRLSSNVILSFYVVQQWRLWCGWHCVRTSRNCDLLLKRSLLPLQCIVSCVTKVKYSDSGSERTVHLNDIQYTIWAVALIFIVGSRGNMCVYGDNRSVVGNDCGCRRSSYGSWVHIKRSKRRGHVRSFSPRGWWGSLIKLFGGRALMDVSAILLSLFLLATFSHQIICRYL